MARRALAGVVASLVLIAAVATAASAWQQGTASAGDTPEFMAALQRGETALQRKQYEAALDAFTAANRLQDKTSSVALYGMGRAFHGLSAWKSEADACAEALKFVGSDQKLEALIHNQRGLAFVQLGQKPGDKAFKDAEAEFRAVLVQTETLPMAWFNLGIVLLRQNRDPEGIAALQTFVDSGLKAPEVENAKGMIENPRRAREPFAPEFGAASLEGEYITLKGLQGKVVLLDFWGTWCPPCVAATPMLVGLAKAHQKDSRFLMLSVSTDSAADVSKLRAFIEQHKMFWPEIHDPSRKIPLLYSVTNYPTYIVIDHEGIIRERLQGYGASTTFGRLDSAIKDALKSMGKK